MSFNNAPDLPALPAAALINGAQNCSGNADFTPRLDTVITAERCGHAYGRLPGCRRCIDACGSRAIRPGENVPVIDAEACTGCAECVTACPSGALQLFAPPQKTVLEQALTAMSGCPSPPVVVFFESRADLPPFPDGWPETVAIACTPFGALGLETLLAVLAAGASGITVLPGPRTASRTARLVGEQVEVARLLIMAMGYPADLVTLPEPGVKALNLPALPPTARERAFPAEVPLGLPKRDLARWAIRQLACTGIQKDALVALPAGAPYGEVTMEDNACTLCMACTSLCPTGALLGAGETIPGLLFREADCIQCGLCAAGCPESALQINPRMNFDAHLKATVAVLKKDVPYMCARCGAPFATRAMIETISARLAGHWLFGTESEKHRLRLCRTCRIRDMFEEKKGASKP